MEQHPVPQDVTGFQFRLIGDITLKQFGYLVGGVILGYLSTKLTLIPVFLRWPMGGFWVLLGIGLAFLPIEERPLDVWLMSFFKRIYSPTQYVWKKQNLPPDILVQTLPTPMVIPSALPYPKLKPVPEKKAVSAPLQPAPTKEDTIRAKPVPPPPTAIPKPLVDRWSIGAPPVKPKPEPTQTLPKVTGEKIVFAEKPTAPPPVADTQQVERIRAGYEKTTKDLETRLALLQTELAKGSVGKERIVEFQQVLKELLAEKERLSKELAAVRKKLTQDQSPRTEKPTDYIQAPEETKTTVKMVTPQAATRIGIPRLTTQPNVITGIIKDSGGVLLPNMIITVKDKEDIPVRALKTNRLGQFAASTPLSNSTYFIEVEDPKKAFEFNRIEVSLTGLVLPPLEITAVSQKDIVRQRLSRELFGNNTL